MQAEYLRSEVEFPLSICYKIYYCNSDSVADPLTAHYVKPAATLQAQAIYCIILHEFV